MKKIFAIATLISSFMLISCEKEPVDTNDNTGFTSIIGGGWCKPAVTVNHQTNTTANQHPAPKLLKGKE